MPTQCYHLQLKEKLCECSIAIYDGYFSADWLSVVASPYHIRVFTWLVAAVLVYSYATPAKNQKLHHTWQWKYPTSLLIKNELTEIFFYKNVLQILTAAFSVQLLPLVTMCNFKVNCRQINISNQRCFFQRHCKNLASIIYCICVAWIAAQLHHLPH